MPPIPSDDLPDSVDGATVEAMLENVRRLVAYEEQRLSALTTRGSGLVGLSGLATAVISAAGSDAAFPLVSKVLFVGAMAGLIFVAAAVVLGMMTPRPGTIQSTRRLALYTDPAYQSVSPERVKVQMLDSLVKRLKGLREQNKLRAMWLSRSALVFVVAVTLTALASVIRFFA